VSARETPHEREDELLHAIVEATPIPLIITRLSDGKILYVNESLASLVGLVPKELIGRKSPNFYYDPEDRKIVLEKLKKYGFLKHHEVRLKKADGTMFWSIFSLVSADIMGEKVIIGGIYDISKRKQAEEAQDRLVAILEGTTDLVAFANQDGNLRYLNSAGRRMLGIEDEFDISKIKLYELHPDWSHKKIKEKILSSAIKEGGWSGEFVFLHRDGHEIPVSMVIFAHKNPKGEIEGFSTISRDVTERKRAEKALTRERNIAQMYLDVAGVIFVVINKDQKVVLINQKGCNILGYKEHEIVGKNWFDNFLPKEGIKEVKKAFGKLMVGKVELIEYYENPVLTKNGEERIIAWHNTIIRDEKGNVISTLSSGEDITDRKKAEEALGREQNFISAVLDTASALVVVLDPKGHIIRYNRACEKIHGYTLEEVRGKKIWDLAEDPECRKQSRENFERLINSYFPSMSEDTLDTKKGDKRLVAWTYSAIYDENGSLEYIIGTGIDITERKQAEVALRVSEERFRSIVENAEDIIYSMSTDGVFTYISPKFKEITGYEGSEFIGESFAPLVHPDDRKAIWGFFKKAIETGEAHGGVEYRIQHKDGSLRWFTTHASAIKDDKGNVIDIVGIVHDITEIRKVLDDLSKANLNLRETQAQLVQSEKMASLGMLVAGIAHEINTPVGAIHSMHDTLVRSLGKLNQTLQKQFPDEYKENTSLAETLTIIKDANRVIESGTERVTTIVKRLRSFARLDEAALKNANIEEGIEDTLTLVHHEIKNRIQVIKNYGKIPVIACYPGQLNQVFLNLLINANQAIKDHGEIKITTLQRDNTVHVVIEDNGVGIPKENLNKIFDPGFTTKGVGTGLGLSICYQIVKDHRGTIWVESEEGKGTKFTVIIPTNLDEILENT
jgi:PAS domain S-box-containing protein